MILKKIFSILLALVVVINLHLAWVFHYCGGKLSNTNVNAFYADACCCLEMNNNQLSCLNYNASITKEECCKSSLQIWNIYDFLISKLPFSYLEFLSILPIKIVSISSVIAKIKTIYTHYLLCSTHNKQLALLGTFLK